MENLVLESEFLASSPSFSIDDICPSLFLTIPIPERAAGGIYQVNEVVDKKGLCVGSGPLRKSHLDRIQPVRDGGHTYERRCGEPRGCCASVAPRSYPCTGEREGSLKFRSVLRKPLPAHGESFSSHSSEESGILLEQVCLSSFCRARSWAGSGQWEGGLGVGPEGHRVAFSQSFSCSRRCAGHVFMAATGLHTIS